MGQGTHTRLLTEYGAHHPMIFAQELFGLLPRCQSNVGSGGLKLGHQTCSINRMIKVVALPHIPVDFTIRQPQSPLLIDHPFVTGIVRNFYLHARRDEVLDGKQIVRSLIHQQLSILYGLSKRLIEDFISQLYQDQSGTDRPFENVSHQVF